MKSPYQMKTIQIQLTNACPHKCSNCTRFCGWHEKPFFMDFETFKKAVDSLEGYEGMIGIMGGQPTLNPEFDKMVDYLNEKVKQDKRIKPMILPQDDVSKYRDRNQNDICSKKGIWSCCNKTYYDNMQKIQDSFRYQCLNDHSNSGKHQALLIARKDVGISNREFQILRDKCWINNMWSASITPKGCFFCEVAAALDMLFDGQGGVPIEKGWYLRRPQDFGDQLKWCELCSACLAVPSKEGNEQIDTISPTLYEMLKDKKSYKAINKKYEIFTMEDYASYNGEVNTCKIDPYIEIGMDRVDKNNDDIKPHKIDFCYIGEGSFDKSLLSNEHGNCFKIGEWISKEDMQNKKFDDWCLIIKNNYQIDLSIFNRVFNPGVLYVNQDYYFVNQRASSLKNYKIDEDIEKRFIENKKCFIGKFHVQEENIKYSFLMPTYNSVETLERAVNGILNQDYKNFNVYFCDDSSTDDTMKMLKQYMKKDDRIKFIAENEINSSAVISRNKLIDLADGDYSIWVDSDDEVNTNICSFATWLLNQERFDIISFPFQVVDHSKNDHNFGRIYQYHKKLYGKDCYDFFASQMRNPYNLWSKVIKTDLLKKMKLPDITIYLVDDNVFAYPLYYNCQSFLSVNSEKMYKYHYGSGVWGKDIIQLNKYFVICNSIQKAWQLNYKFVIQHEPKIEYIQKLIIFTPLSYPTSLINKLEKNERFSALNYCMTKFKFVKDLQEYITKFHKGDFNY